jgi:DNA-binding NtrC family response regulator
MPKIIAIDDDAYVLRSLQRELRGQPFELSTETDPVAALARMQAEEFDVVIADCRMPGMDGVQLLAEMSRCRPQTVRIMLSGHADMQDILNSIDAAGVFRFISKPWNLAELRTTLAEALAQRRQLLEPAQTTHTAQRAVPLQ